MKTEIRFVFNIQNSNFIKGETKKTANGENITLRFKDDTTVKLKLVSSGRRLLAEDEMFLESYAGKDVSFFDRLAADFLGFRMIIIGAIGETFGSVIGKIL